MKKAFNVPYLLQVLKSGKKAYPKDLFYKALMKLVKIEEFGLTKHVDILIANCERENLLATECYLNRTLMKEK